MRNITQDFQNKLVTIMGLGLYKQGTGIEAVKFFLRHGARVVVTDLRSERQLKENALELMRYYRKLLKCITPPTSPYLKGRIDQGPPLKVRGGAGGVMKPSFVLGRHRAEDFKNTDMVFQNPSVPADSPYLKIARKHKIPIVNDWSLFLSRHTPKLFVGVTGTRGKSTITALIYEMMKQWHPAIPRNRRMKVWLAGNLGVSPLSFIDKYKGEPIVAELSSWLLHHFPMAKKSPDVAVVTNIMNDHMNKYDSLREYIEDKENIFKFQKSSDVAIFNYDDSRTRAMAQKARGKVVWFSLKKHWPKWVPLSAVLISGEHNKANALAAAAAAEAAGVSRTHIIEVLKTFKGLSSRLELVRTVRGVQYYNDTTATTPDATIAALRTLNDVIATASEANAERGGKQSHTMVKRSPRPARARDDRSVILIAGGADKKLEYKELAREIIKYCKAVVLLPGSATIKLKKGLIVNSQSLIVNRAEDMRQAVKKAFNVASKGDVVLLSPAAASFGLFDNEFDRGKQFVACVKKL